MDIFVKVYVVIGYDPDCVMFYGRSHNNYLRFFIFLKVNRMVPNFYGMTVVIAANRSVKVCSL